jgi:hypothetical protein
MEWRIANARNANHDGKTSNAPAFSRSTHSVMIARVFQNRVNTELRRNTDNRAESSKKSGQVRASIVPTSRGAVGVLTLLYTNDAFKHQVGDDNSVWSASTQRSRRRTGTTSDGHDAGRARRAMIQAVAHKPAKKNIAQAAGRESRRRPEAGANGKRTRSVFR